MNFIAPAPISPMDVLLVLPSLYNISRGEYELLSIQPNMGSSQCITQHLEISEPLSSSNGIVGALFEFQLCLYYLLVIF